LTPAYGEESQEDTVEDQETIENVSPRRANGTTAVEIGASWLEGGSPGRKG
jgi:hypothetical protein